MKLRIFRCSQRRRQILLRRSCAAMFFVIGASLAYIHFRLGWKLPGRFRGVRTVPAGIDKQSVLLHYADAGLDVESAARHQQNPDPAAAAVRPAAADGLWTGHNAIASYVMNRQFSMDETLRRFSIFFNTAWGDAALPIDAGGDDDVKGDESDEVAEEGAGLKDKAVEVKVEPKDERDELDEDNEVVEAGTASDEEGYSTDEPTTSTTTTVSYDDDDDAGSDNEEAESDAEQQQHGGGDQTKTSKNKVVITSTTKKVFKKRTVKPVTSTVAPSSSSTPSDLALCDAECELFRSRLETWPRDKPKAVIYYLIHRSSLKNLFRSIGSVDKHFNRRFRYPIVVFVEPDMDNDVDRKFIMSSVAKIAPTSVRLLYIQVVRFRLPPYVDEAKVPKLAGFGRRKRTIGYRHMCRFHAGGVYDQPIIRSAGLEFGWRLDDDSLLTSAINYNVFQYMHDHDMQYGYRKINRGWSPVDFALWDAVDGYINNSRLQPTFYRQWPKNKARFFNNFEISALKVWMSPAYQDYFRFVDRLGGIYYYKWGDAAIKTIAVTLFIPRHKTHLFKDVKYAHKTPIKR